jgi:ferredoxin
MPYVVNENCILCGACVAGCETAAISEGDTQSHIDVTVCVECGNCKINCPVGAIDFLEDVEEVVQPASKEKESNP